MRLALVSVNKGSHPPLGLVYIATYLKKFMNQIDIRIIDANFDDLVEETKAFHPDVVGISSMTVDYTDAMTVGDKIKQTLNVPVIVGGVHISTLPNCLGDFDLGVIGEGEETALELMRIFERHNGFPSEELAKTKGIVFKDNGRTIINERRELIEPLDRIPIPDRSFLNENYFKPRWLPFVQKNATILDVMTSRGCPYNCVFCSTSLFWQRRPRFHSPEHVLEDVKQLTDRYKMEYVSIADDLFTTNKERIKEMASLFEKNGINKKATFSCMARANLLDEEMCQLMKRMNVKFLNFGFESGSPKMLKFLKTGTATIEDSKNAVALCKKYGLKATGSFIFGSPTETIDDMKQTIEFMKALKRTNSDIDIWQFVMTPFPGTEIWEIAKRRGKVSDDMKDWRELDHYNVDNPRLLDDSVDRSEFKETFLEARATTDSIKVGKQWIMNKLRHDKSRLIRTALSNPGRTFKVLKHIVMSKAE